MNLQDERAVTVKLASEILGCKRSYMTALRRAMGIRSRYFFMSDVRNFLRSHPNFIMSQIYHPSKCCCAVCGEKRAARLAAGSSAPAKQGILPPFPAPSFSVDEPLVVKKATKAEKPLKAGTHPVYSELGRKLKMLRGRLSAGAVAAKARVSTESVRRIEHGDSVKVDTLRKIASAMGVARAQWLGLLIAWLKFEAGKDSDELRIEPQVAGLDTALEHLSAQTSEAMRLFDGLNPVERENVILALRRKEVLKCLVTINAAINDGEELRAAA